MDGLTIGLAFGFAVAGGALGFLLHATEPRRSGPLAEIAVCGIIAAVLGLAIGSGIDFFTDDYVEIQTTSIEQKCVDNMPEGQSAVITKDALGNMVCSYQ